ncbi:multidrug resistance protein [Patescibacteria group bacterium]|nr:multidrug resistance protein [Patescibacteria group bacterium]
MLKNYIIILLTICISVIAQTLLKTGMKEIGTVESLSLEKIIPLAIKMGTNVFVLAGLSLYGIGTFFWLILLSRLDLSFLYPFGTLQYFFIFIVSYLVFGEDIKLARIVGVSIILVGIFIISKFG